MKNGLKYAHIFSKILAFSGAYVPIRIVDNGGVPVDDGVSDVAFQCRVFGDPMVLATSDLDPRFIFHGLKESGKEIPRIFMTEGSEDFLLTENRSMRDFLQKKKRILCISKIKELMIGTFGISIWMKRLLFWQNK